ncbi:cysteine synthase A [Sphingopyxis sp. YR583]|uniref:PLP-dependent cysteine synthase family protein n=1 Tax=Sphingopyxis sp. YR583 TaxID=1881047 RepID=UPI0008A755E6|nr:pyridoxal-phosphate dependent enzyme [Sphingopyxis sp. YR583]SEH13028.1 cysteine synthase A [Sphingopyxis sp. YR583]
MPNDRFRTPPGADMPAAARRARAATTSHLRLVSDRDDAGRGLSDPDRVIDLRHWSRQAMAYLHAERAQAPETPLLPVPLPEFPGVQLLIKDESVHPSGSLKHRLAHALFVQGIASGAIGPDTLIVEASSGSTAIAEAWYAKKLGLRALAVVSETIAPAKRRAIVEAGGDVMDARPGTDLAATAAEVAVHMGGYHMDQFARAADAPDWRGPHNIAARLALQLDALGFDAPAWIVAGAGTGGTAATIGRYLRHAGALGTTRLCVVDPEGSAYFKAFASGDMGATGTSTPHIEGIGRARVGPAFLPGVIDHMIAVSDEGSVAGTRWLGERIDRRFGPSTGTNVIGALILAQAMARRGKRGHIVMLGCDGGDRYAETIWDRNWCKAAGLDCGGWHALLGKLGAADFPAAY